MEEVVLVDQQDREIGTIEKLEAHRKGLLHRAFSVLLFNSNGELLIQKRAYNKYHSAGLWTNTCCSHPRPEEIVAKAAQRRLREELGIAADLKPIHSFIYKVTLERGLIEHELDHVLIGKFDGEPAINKSEVSDWRFVTLADLRGEIAKSPEAFTHWFKLMMGDPKITSLLPA